MPNISYPPKRPLTVGEILDLTFQIYRATLLKVLLLAGLARLFSQLPNIYSLLRGEGHGGGLGGIVLALNEAQRHPAYWLLYLLGMIIDLTLYAAVIMRQHELITGGDAGGEVMAGLRRVPAMIGAALLISLSVGVCFIPAAPFTSLGRVLAVAVLLIPASYLMVMASLAIVAVVVERKGPVEGYLRSWSLVTGSFWRVSTVYTVGVLVLLVFWVTLGSVVGVLAAIIGRGDVALVAATGGVLMLLTAALAMPFFTAMALAVYGELLTRKEGADLEQRIGAPA